MGGTGKEHRRLAFTGKIQRLSCRGASTRMEFSVIPYGESCLARKRVYVGIPRCMPRYISPVARDTRPVCRYVTRNIAVKAYLKIGKYFFRLAGEA